MAGRTLRPGFCSSRAGYLWPLLYTLLSLAKDRIVMSNVSAPFRAEVFSIERLEEYARTWAEQDQPWPPNRRGQRLLSRLAENDRVLLAAQKRFSEAVRLGKPL